MSTAEGPETPTPGPESPFQEPDHPDYEALIKVALEHLDGPAQQPGFDLTEHVEQVIDHKSAVFVAISRSISFLEIAGPDVLHDRMDEVMRTALFWLDGLYIGAQFERTQQSAEAGLES